jgi:hypothetical protein
MSNYSLYERYACKTTDKQCFFIFASYVEVFSYSNAQLAWEYVRRNPDYKHDWELTDKFHSDRQKLENVLVASNLHEDTAKSVYDEWMRRQSSNISELPKKWGLQQLENPSQPAFESTFQWSPDFDVQSVKYTVEENTKWRGKKRSITELDAKFSAFLDQDGYHLTVQHKGQTLRLHGEQSPFLIGNEVLRLVDDPSKCKTQNMRARHKANRVFRETCHPTIPLSTMHNREEL